MVKMTLSGLRGQKLPVNFDFRGHISTFKAENTTKNGGFKAQKLSTNYFWPAPKQLSKSPENGFFDPENGQNDPLRGQNFDT